jgi:hypothetical protein
LKGARRAVKLSFRVTNSGTEMSVEATDLQSLVAHRSSIPASSTVEEAQVKFRNSDVDFIAVLDEGKLVGVEFNGRAAV